jgi:hypothetical protein
LRNAEQYVYKIERRATRVGVDGCDVNLHTVLDAKGQRNVEPELLS